uniref:Cytosolic fatty-acid binding proteins domain-containing protein n=1 Tax=Meloidogyne javanica TaxID=6303 RepID=A0A915N5J1_MELJA
MRFFFFPKLSIISIIGFLWGIIAIISISSVSALTSVSTTSKALPDKFLGSWTVDHSENFDEYLEAKGYGWFMRQMHLLAGITKTFTKNDDGSYGCKIETTKKNVEWPKFNLGEEFTAEYLDDSMHKIKFTYDAKKDSLTEVHTKVDAPNDPADVYDYIIDGDGWLVMHMEYNDVKTKRFYKKL